MESSKELYTKKELENCSEFIYSNGFINLSKKINLKTFSSSNLLIIVLAGLGSTTILKILENYPKEWVKIKNVLILILPHTHPLKIFDWFKQNEWKLRKEKYFRYNKKIYPILLFSKGLNKLESFEILAENSKSDLYWEYWDNYYEWRAKFKKNKEDKSIKQWMEWYSKVRLNKKI